jgi:hypothetical protein
LNSSPKKEYQIVESVAEEEQKKVVEYIECQESIVDSSSSKPLDDKITQYNQQVTFHRGDSTLQFTLETKQELKPLDPEKITPGASPSPPRASYQSNESTKQSNTTVTNRPKKPTLAELCSRTNFARNRTKVGLSKKIRIDSLHTYLSK